MELQITRANNEQVLYRSFERILDYHTSMNRITDYKAREQHHMFFDNMCLDSVRLIKDLPRIIVVHDPLVVNLHELFNQLSADWQMASLVESSMAKITMHPAYQRIIGLGEQVVPLILESMKQEPHHWFAALRAITGQNPVDSKEAGDLNAMTQAWLRWGYAYAYIS